MATHYCEKCNRTMDEKEFYRSNNLEKYPDGGLMNQCKKCLTMHVDNWDPNTFLWILEDIDVPWIPEEWNKLMAKWARDATKVTGVTIMGRYLSKMRLKQFRDYRWKDTEFLQQMANNKIKQAMESQGYAASDIARAVEMASQAIPTGGIAPPPKEALTPVVPLEERDLPFVQMPERPAEPEPDYFDQLNGISEDDLKVDLTDDDKLRLRLKWGKHYKPEEWVQLEKFYNEMMESYDIQTAAHIDTLKLICKTSLKANQLLDIGDVEAYQKMSKVYDSLMKSGKFTAAQNKAENGEYVDSISEIVAICEKDGFIPRYYDEEGHKDHVDRVLQDLQGYTRQLITEEMNLGNLIDNALKQIENDKEREAQESADAATAEELFEGDLSAEEENRMFETIDNYEELRDNEEEMIRRDEETIARLARGEI